MSQPLTLRTEAGDEHIDFEEFENRVRRGEIAPQCLVCFPAVTGEVFVPACTLETYKALHQPRHAYFSRVFSLGRFPFLTTILIGINVTVYLLTVQQGPVDIDSMVQWGGKVGPMVFDLGQFWRLLTANFLHRDGLHIGLNLFVLLNVGRVLENAYRILDVLGLFLVSAMMSMVVSLYWADAVTVGASGMVYGGLGGGVAFGLKYRSLLPPRYQRLMSEAAIPIVLGLLLLGIVPWGGGGQVDNWAHAGGVLTGFVYGLFLRPKLLVEPSKGFWNKTLHTLPTFLVLGGAILGPWFFQPMKWPELREERDDELGLLVSVPSRWRPGAYRMGQLAFYNGLPGLGRATLAVEMLNSRDAKSSAELFLEEGLTPQRLGGEILSIKGSPPEKTRLAQIDAWKVEAQFDERISKTRLWAFFVGRGKVTYQIIFTFPAEFPSYETVIQRMVSSIQLNEPREMREARGRALLFPNSSSALGALGMSFRKYGEDAHALFALRKAVTDKEVNDVIRAELAFALLDIGNDEEGCQMAQEALQRAPKALHAIKASAHCEVSLGAHQRALERIESALEWAPHEAELIQARSILQKVLATEGAVQSGAPKRD